MAATVKDIAQRTGLGLATISKYLNGGHVLKKNQALIEEAIKALDFQVNELGRGLKTGKSHTVGVVIPELSNLFSTTIISQMEDLLRQQGYGVLVCDCRTDPKLEGEAIRFLMARRVDGLINMPVGQGDQNLRPALQKGLPVLLMDRLIPGLDLDAVLVDNVSAARESTAHLLERGHREIGVIAGPAQVFTSSQRLMGCQDAYRQAGLDPEGQHIAFGDYTVQGGYSAAKALIQAHPAMTAMLVTNYEMTLGAVIALNELGLTLGREMSMIGFDNMQLSQVVKPGLCVVEQPLKDMGAALAGRMMERLRGEGVPSPQVQYLNARLCPGKSVRKVSATKSDRGR